MTEPRSVNDWRAFGLRTASGGRLPTSDVPASLLFAGTRAFLVYDNYHALLGYNCANTYALSVALLSDALN
jgi:membrane-bound lytic murein transglycosylase B